MEDADADFRVLMNMKPAAKSALCRRREQSSVAEKNVN